MLIRGGVNSMLILLVVVVLLIIYFALKDSNVNEKHANYIKSNSSLPSSSLSISPLHNPSVSQSSSDASTGVLARNTEGSILEDKCERCGGEWVKHSNRRTGGDFFSCTNFPTCNNTKDKQRAKYFCGNGHKRTSTNTSYNSDGSRRCLVCRPIPRSDSISSYSFPRSISIDGIKYCSNGHPRTSENTYVSPDGKTRCRVCRKEARR